MLFRSSTLAFIKTSTQRVIESFHAPSDSTEDAHPSRTIRAAALRESVETLLGRIWRDGGAFFRSALAFVKASTRRAVKKVRGSPSTEGVHRSHSVRISRREPVQPNLRRMRRGGGVLSRSALTFATVSNRRVRIKSSKPRHRNQIWEHVIHWLREPIGSNQARRAP